MFGFLFFQVILCVCKYSATIEPEKSWSCGYDSCTQAQKDVLNVHIVPHTHNDLGWLKTIDQYYYGSRNDIQKAGVQYILDSVVKELWEDSKRRFTYVETAFFWKWWLQQPNSVKDKVQVLVQQGRLKFAGGAWSMNDEAVTYYQNIIDQFTLGLKKLNDTFGPCATPRVAWQIAPFGHSKEFASLLAAMGYDGLFLGRIHFEDKWERLQNKTMEMVWRGDDDLGSASDIFTGVLYNVYYPPQGFCFDVLCDDEPIIDDAQSPMFNVDKKVDKFYEEIQKLAKVYKTNNVLFTMGGDFHYQEAGMWYTNLDKLIKHFNEKAVKENLNVHLFYSTPDCYLKAVMDANPILPTKQDDFFPYASGDHSYWTGYYASRPIVKYMETEASQYVQMAKQIYVLADLNETNASTLDELKSIIGIMQHHEAVTGTHRRNVTLDYKRLLSKAVDDTLRIADLAFTKLGTDKTEVPIYSFDKCHLNESACTVSENSKNFILTIYNPLPWAISSIVYQIPVVGNNYEVVGHDGNKVDVSIVTIPQDIIDWLNKHIPSRHSIATHWLSFMYSLQALEYKSFYITKVEKADHIGTKPPIDFGEYSTHGKVSDTIYIREGDYYAESGNNSEEIFRSSGAYIFRPTTTKPYYNITNTLFLKRSNLKLPGMVTFTSFLPPPNVSDNIGKECVFNHTCDSIKPNSEFYTDSNGRHTIKRINRTTEEPVAGNYYPVTNRIIIKDDTNRYTVFPDRPVGVRSSKEGALEILFNRKLLHDDGIGLGEPLNEMEMGLGLALIISQTVCYRKPGKEDNIKEKKTALEIQLPPVLMFSDAKSMNLSEWLKLNQSGSALKQDFPLGLHLLTLEHWDKGKLLLRLENYLEKSDRNETTIDIDMSNIFKTLTIKSFRETTLAANQWVENGEKWIWTTENNFIKNIHEKSGRFSKIADMLNLNQEKDGFKINLQPKQIRTFIVEYEMKK